MNTPIKENQQIKFPPTCVQVLVNEDWIARGAAHFLEVEKLVVEGAGATALGALLAIPDICPELIEKK